MSSNVEITSKEMIKPSSPTPSHLRNLKLSILDQFPPSSYIPLIFFYKPRHPKLLQDSLKKSLSNVLAKFYPLAGRFSRENFSIDCNDLGALFVECKVEGNVLEVFKDPTMDELRKYLPPVESSDYGEANAIVLAVQINLFDCGGVAVAVQMHHKVVDASSMVSFMNAWAAASRGGDDHQRFSPTFDIAILFPPKDKFSSGSDSSEPPPNLPPVTEKIVAKRLVFDKKDLENLKLRASQVIKDPTRVEAVSSFLLKHIREASRARGSNKNLVVLHTVNLRPRMDPPLPNHAFGNAVGTAVGLLPVNDDDEVDILGVLRNAVRKTNGDFVKEMLHGDDETFLNSVDNFKAMCLKEETWYFSSWTRFPVYEVDYGWGRPIWVSTTSPPYKNMVTLMSTSCGEGMEAWVNVLEEDDAFIDFSS